MKLKPLLMAGFVLAFTAMISAAAPTESEARSSAEAWLALVDHHQYDESWAEAGSAFRSQVSQDKWVDMAKQVRTPLGPVVSRSLLKATITKTLPGLPDGDYAVVQFRSAFKNKASAVETVTLAFEDGKLRAIGYFIK